MLPAVIQFHDDAPFDDEIRLVPFFKFDSLINDWDRHLSFYFEVLIPKFVGQNYFIDMFK
jgi:hypothetical protein